MVLGNHLRNVNWKLCVRAFDSIFPRLELVISLSFRRSLVNTSSLEHFECRVSINNLVMYMLILLERVFQQPSAPMKELATRGRSFHFRGHEYFVDVSLGAGGFGTVMSVRRADGRS